MRRLILFVILFILTDLYIEAGEVKIAVASNFYSTLNKIVDEFEKNTGHQVKLSSASSGKLYAQILHGAPFDLFFSADQLKPEALEQKNLVEPESRFTYAIGRIVLWSNSPLMTELQQTGSDKDINFKNLLYETKFKKLALANPKIAPYGKASIEILNHLDLTEKLRHKFVYGENILQSFQYVRTKNADFGFIALSQLLMLKDKGLFWEVPTELYQPIKQDVVLLKASRNKTAAQEFLAFLAGQKVTNMIKSDGYLTEK